MHTFTKEGKAVTVSYDRDAKDVTVSLAEVNKEAIVFRLTADETDELRAMFQ